jgi:trimethylamine---corrinoid protein Co-methyltransferase
MNKYTFDTQPKLRLISDEQIKMVHEKALHILEQAGVKIESDEALKILQDHGAKVDFEKHLVKISPKMVDEAINKTPPGFKLYNREGELAAEMSGNKSHFDPGSSVIKFMESDGATVRRTESKDLIQISRVNDALDNIHLQSTAVVCYDVPELIGDSYRLYLCLKESPKAIITGAFSVAGIKHMREMLAAVVGGYDQLSEKPLAVFDICPSQPLKWTHISAENIIDCARFNLPQELISVPMPGAATPITLAGSLIVHTAETLSGIVLAQCASPGVTVVYGGAPVQFDMRFSTTPMSAVEATMISAAYSQMGKYFGLPTHTYAALSDSKLVDMQAGAETAMSATIALLSGINMISGAGALDFINTFSLEKLEIDNDICGMILRAQRGIEFTDETMAVDLIEELGPGGTYLETDLTMKYFRSEPYMPSKVIDRQDRKNWEEDGSRTIFERAREKVKDLQDTHVPAPLDKEREGKLDTAVGEVMKELGIDSLPRGPK